MKLSLCRFFFAVLLFSAVSALHAAPAIQEKGNFQIGGFQFAFKCFNSKWQAPSQNGNAFSVRSRTDAVLEAEADFPLLGKGIYRQTFTPKGGETWLYEGELALPEGAKPAQVALSTFLPVDDFRGLKLEIDGAPFELPIEPRKKEPLTLLWKKIRKVTIPGVSGTLTVEGDFILLVHDHRVGGCPKYELRFLWAPVNGAANRYRISLLFHDVPFVQAAVDLKPAFTAGFADEKADDRQGGWTDQGSGNDLRMLRPGTIHGSGRVPFEIVPPEANGGKSCVVLRGPFRGYFPESVSAVQRTPVRGNWLYLLHATAWPTSGKIGEIGLEYADGTGSRIPVSGETDVGNWWQPRLCPNGRIAWTGENKSAVVGLYQSVFRIEDKPIRKISFTSTGASVWGIVAATVSSGLVPEQDTGGPVFIREGEDWKPIRNEKDIEAGSVLDFSGVLDAPAGKYGPVVVRNGHFEFRDRPGTPVRFYGTNLVDSAQFLTHEWSGKLAERMARSGFNLIRIHHHDNGLTVRKDGKSTELNPENLDRLNYLIACFKRRGIYVVTDCYVSRTFAPGELPELERAGFKTLVFQSRAAMENWKRFVRNWFSAVNPYTGLALREDPVLIGVNLVNEGNIGTSWNGKSKEYYLEKYRQYLAEKGIADREQDRDRLMAAYLVGLYRKGFDEMKSFLRDELGMKNPISDQNHRSELLSCVMRDGNDFVDNHYYFDHPRYPVNAWRLPARIDNVSTISRECGDLAWMFLSRIWNKPMMITEFDYARPNFYRAEGAVLTGAYAGLQDWDGLVQFAYSHGGYNVTADQAVGNPFDLSSDVVKALSHRIGVKLFLEREIKPSPVVLAMALGGTANMNFSMIPGRELRQLGLIAGVGMCVLPGGESHPEKLPPRLRAFLNAGINFPAASAGTVPVVKAGPEDNPIEELRKRGILSPGCYDAKRKSYRSEGGQLELDAKAETFRASAPGIDVLILPAKQSGTSGILTVNNRIGRGVFSLQSADGKPLRESRRMLLLHLTDSQASLLKFDDATLTQHSTWGKAPHLAARGEADIRIALPAGKYRLFSCDTAGKRLAEIPVRTGPGGRLEFEANVFRPEGRVFVYELTGEPAR